MYKYEFKQFSLKIVVFIIAFVNYFIIDWKVEDVIIIKVYIFFKDIIITFVVIKFFKIKIIIIYIDIIINKIIINNNTIIIN